MTIREAKEQVAKESGWSNWSELSDSLYWDGDATGMHDKMQQVAELYSSKQRENDFKRIKELEDALGDLLIDSEKLWNYAAMPPEDKSGWSFKKARKALNL